jgi:phage FluMu protein Com
MKTSIPCPHCQKAITLEDFEDFSSPFTMKCPSCKAKLKETKVTPFLLIGMIAIIPVFIYLTETLISLLSGILPVIEKIPSIIVFLGLLYPVYALYERVNGLIMFNKGNLQLKKRQ